MTTRKLADVIAGPPVRSTSQGGLVLMHCVVTMGSSVIGSQVTDTPGLSVARAGAGDFDVTFPACAKVWGVSIMVDNVGTPADVVPQLRSVNATAGTMSFDTLAAATGTDPADTTKIFVTIHAAALSVD